MKTTETECYNVTPRNVPTGRVFTLNLRVTSALFMVNMIWSDGGATAAIKQLEVSLFSKTQRTGAASFNFILIIGLQLSTS